MTPLVLSLFPGIGLLDLAFEERGHAFRAWAAALLDGEGCISIAKSHQAGRPRDVYYRVDLLISNSCVDLLAPLRAGLGGRIDRTHPDTTTRRACFQWKTTGSGHSARVLRDLRPWIIAKAARADLALEACALLERTGYRCPPGALERLAELKVAMHVFNKRGPR